MEAGGVRRLGDVDLFEQPLVPQATGAAVHSLLPPLVVPWRGTERPLAIDEDIVLGHVVVPAMREHRSKAPSTRVTATQKDIPEHNVTTIARALGGQAPAGGMQGKLRPHP